jgi:hypothetical protein
MTRFCGDAIPCGVFMASKYDAKRQLLHPVSNPKHALFDPVAETGV